MVTVRHFDPGPHWTLRPRSSPNFQIMKLLGIIVGSAWFAFGVLQFKIDYADSVGASRMVGMREESLNSALAAYGTHMWIGIGLVVVALLIPGPKRRNEESKGS